MAIAKFSLSLDQGIPNHGHGKNNRNEFSLTNTSGFDHSGLIFTPFEVISSLGEVRIKTVVILHLSWGQPCIGYEIVLTSTTGTMGAAPETNREKQYAQAKVPLKVIIVG